MHSDDVSNYIHTFEGVTKDRLIQLRELAHTYIPNAQEKISYSVPTLCDEKGTYIAYFAGYADFVSIYPIHLAKPVEGIEKHLSGKSTARFLHTEPLPITIISQLFENLWISYQTRNK